MVGDSRSAIKGSGFEFDQIREYQIGDDVRLVDWKSSARYGKVLIKQYIEERDRTIIIAVDISASSFFSSVYEQKWERFQKIAAVLALVAEYGKDNVSLILFSDEVELFIPPGRGRFHAHKILEQLFLYKPKKRKTSLEAVLKKLAAMKRRDSVVFLISDFIDSSNGALLSVVAKHYDVIAVSSLDQHEQTIPAVGFLPVKDIETGEELCLDTRKRRKNCLDEYLKARVLQKRKIFMKYGIDFFELTDHKSLIADTINFFRRRMMY